MQSRWPYPVAIWRLWARRVDVIPFRDMAMDPEGGPIIRLSRLLVPNSEDMLSETGEGNEQRNTQTFMCVLMGDLIPVTIHLTESETKYFSSRTARPATRDGVLSHPRLTIQKVVCQTEL
jgi:hypothetical protein